MDNLGIVVLIITNVISIAGFLAKIVFDYMKGDDKSNQLSVQNLTMALHEAKLEIARLQERLDALNKHMKTFASMWGQMNILNSRITRLEMTSDFERECHWTEKEV